jgi:hypothetical protein
MVAASEMHLERGGIMAVFSLELSKIGCSRAHSEAV